MSLCDPIDEEHTATSYLEEVAEDLRRQLERFEVNMAEATTEHEESFWFGHANALRSAIAELDKLTARRLTQYGPGSPIDTNAEVLV